MRRMGRKTKLCPEVQGWIVERIREGHYIETMCCEVGVSKNAYYQWLQKGEQQTSGIYRDFYDAVKAAEQQAKRALLGKLHQSIDWRAAAWILERRWPEEWGRQKMEISGPGGAPMQVEATGGSPDPLRVYIVPTPTRPLEENA